MTLLSFNAARGFVGGATGRGLQGTRRSGIVSMPHAALWVVQQVAELQADVHMIVSMPHAALWVVQPLLLVRTFKILPGFNAARGFVGGATTSLAALVPLGGKSPFGKSPEI